MRTAAETKELCYKTLGIYPNDVAEFPRLAPHLRTIGGKSRALEYLRASSNPSARRFLAVYDDIILPSIVRRTLPLEAFCVAAQITAEQFLFAISQSARELRQFEGAMKAAEVHPAVVAKSSELALEGDVDHVTLNMKHMGFLPLPKGSQTQINVSANASAQSAAQSTSVAPSPENTIRRLVGKFNLPTSQPAALPEPKEMVPLDIASRERELVTIDGEYESEDDDV